MLLSEIAPSGMGRSRHRRDVLDRRQTLGHDLLNGLIAYWPLDDSRNSSTNSGWRELHQGLRLSIGSNVPSDVDGIGQQASLFQAASTEYLIRANEAAVQTGDIDFTFAIWVYPNAITATTEDLAGKAGAATFEWFLEQYASGGNHVRFRFGAGDVDFVEASYTTGAWHFIVAWHDSAANTMNYELNNNGTIRSVSNSGGTSTTTDNLRIGGGITNLRWYEGRLMRASMWKRVLTAGERTYLYNGGIGRKYPFV